MILVYVKENHPHLRIKRYIFLNLIYNRKRMPKGNVINEEFVKSYNSIKL